MYNNVDPVVKPKTTKIVPTHLPKINPPNKKIGLQKPKSKTHKIVKIKKINEIRKKFLSFKEIK